MNSLSDSIALAGNLAKESFAEALWPTRCALCDIPHTVLCETCKMNLPYIDWWNACPLCGSPYGRIQCCDCNEFSLSQIERKRLPFLSCASVVRYQSEAARLVRVFKDHGEQRLARELARLMAQVAHPAWTQDSPTVVGIPSTTRAIRARGFDHMELITKEISGFLGLRSAQPLARPRAIDQRKLGRTGRLDNMSNRFKVLPGATVPQDVLLVDDVYTTGSTLSAASEALLDAGATRVRCLTFARVL